MITDNLKERINVLTLVTIRRDIVPTGRRHAVAFLVRHAMLLTVLRGGGQLLLVTSAVGHDVARQVGKGVVGKDKGGAGVRPRGMWVVHLENHAGSLIACNEIKSAFANRSMAAYLANKNTQLTKLVPTHNR